METFDPKYLDLGRLYENLAIARQTLDECRIQAAGADDASSSEAWSAQAAKVEKDIEELNDLIERKREYDRQAAAR